MNKQTIKRHLKLLGLVHRHSTDCYKEIRTTISTDQLGRWQDIISKHMKNLVDETNKIKP